MTPQQFIDSLNEQIMEPDGVIMADGLVKFEGGFKYTFDGFIDSVLLVAADGSVREWVDVYFPDFLMDWAEGHEGEAMIEHISLDACLDYTVKQLSLK